MELQLNRTCIMVTPRQERERLRRSMLYRQHDLKEIRSWSRGCLLSAYGVGANGLDMEMKNHLTAHVVVLSDETVLHEGDVIIPLDNPDGPFLYKPDVSDLGRVVPAMMHMVAKNLYMSHCGDNRPIETAFIGFVPKFGGHKCSVQ